MHSSSIWGQPVANRLSAELFTKPRTSTNWRRISYEGAEWAILHDRLRQPFTMVLRQGERYVAGWNGLVQPTHWTFAVDERSHRPTTSAALGGLDARYARLALDTWRHPPMAVGIYAQRGAPSPGQPPAAERLRDLTGLAAERLGAIFGVSRVMYQRWISGSVTPHSAHREHLLTVLTLVQEAARRLGSSRQVGDWLLQPVASNGPRPMDLLARRDYDALNAEVRLAELLTFEPDWDSYGGDPPTLGAIDAARYLLQTVRERYSAAPPDRSRPFAIAPTPDGGVLVEWRSPGRTISVLIGAEGSLGYLFTEGEGAARRYEEADNVSWELVLDLVHRALRGTAEG
jgi:hypothetical protein